MSHFAHVTNGIVDQVIVAEQDFIDSGAVGDASEWIQTSYNTIGNKHVAGGTPLRGNYAGIGSIYDAVNDVFYAPQPYPSWLLSADYLWEAPVAKPDDGKVYGWDEATTAWVEVAPLEV
jgi:hypothetical protein